MHLKALLTAVFLLFLAGSSTRSALASSSVEACLAEADRAFVGGAVKNEFRRSPVARRDDIVADARGVLWQAGQARRNGSGPRHAVVFVGNRNCWIGGEIVGDGKGSRGAPAAMAVGIRRRTSDTEIHGLTIRKTPNGILAGSAAVDLRLTNILLTKMTDACLVVNHRGDLIVDDAFLDKCARVVNLQSRSVGSRLVIRNSLIRIDDGKDARTRGRLFNRRAHRSRTELYFEGNMVATATKLGRHSLALIERNCSNNTLVWIGEGEYPGDLPDCFVVVEDQTVWRQARRAWKRRHERQLAALPRPAAACELPEIPRAMSPRRTVGRGSPASCTERALRRALAGGGSITFACGPSPVTIPIGSELVVSSPTVLDGGDTITLDGRHRTRILRNDSQLTLRAITLTRGRQQVVWNGSPNGGGAVNTTYGNRLYVVDSTFTDNRTSGQGFGGAIFQAGAGALTVVRSRFESNVGGGGGAIYSLLAGLRVVDSDFVANQGSSGWSGGGGLMTDGASADSGNGRSGGEISLCGTTFDANRALATGGGAYLFAYRGDAVTVTHSTFTANTVTPNAGGVSMGGGLRLGASPALVSNSTFRDNAASMGGAIATTGEARTRVRNSTFECNSSDIEGGKVHAKGNSMRGCQS